jgi:glycosyltransferase involved in cell wall biosynthesis
MIVMVGTALAGRGGMSSVVASYEQEGLLERCGVAYVQAHEEGTALHKLGVACKGLWRLSALLRGGQVGLVHIHLASGASFWRKSLFAGQVLKRRVPLVVHVHGGEFIQFYTRSAPWQQRRIRHVLQGAATVIVLSETWLERFHAVIPGLHLRVVSNPVFMPDVPARGQTSAAAHYLFLGRLEQAKGLYELMQAFAAVARKHPQAQLTLGGEGDLPAIQKWVQAEGLQGKVHLPGWVVGDAKLALLDAANVFVLPSHVEALPVSMLEAMAYGLAPVVSRVGSVPEVLVEGRNGLMVPAQDVAALTAAMLTMATQPEQRRQLGAEARNTVAKSYAAKGVCAELEALYRRLCQTAPIA